MAIIRRNGSLRFAAEMPIGSFIWRPWSHYIAANGGGLIVAFDRGVSSNFNSGKREMTVIQQDV